MKNFDLVMLVFALVCFVLATFNVGGGKFNLVAAGLSFWVASVLF